jgi:hypothetical protein
LPKLLDFPKRFHTGLDGIIRSIGREVSNHAIPDIFSHLPTMFRDFFGGDIEEEIHQFSDLLHRKQTREIGKCHDVTNRITCSVFFTGTVSGLIPSVMNCSTAGWV